MTNEQPTEYAALLNELWNTPGRDEWEPKNRHGYPLIIMQIDHLALSLPGYETWCDEDGEPYWKEFAYRLMKSHAEEWLLENGWDIQHWGKTDVCDKESDWIIRDGNPSSINTLAEALEYAHGQEKE